MKCFSAVSVIDPHLFQNNETDNAAERSFCFEDFPDWCQSCYWFFVFFFPSLLFLTYDHSHVLKSVVSLNAIFEKK